MPALRLGEADLDRMGGLGLVSVLPVPTLAGAALLVAVFAALFRLRHLAPGAAAAHAGGDRGVSCTRCPR